MLRAIIIGFGFMGKTHAINVLKTEGLELCGIVDRTSPGKLMASSGGNFDTGVLDTDIRAIPHFDDTARCLAELRPDLAIICVPTFLHESTTRLCLEQGCHVLLEKPICLDLTQAEELIALAKEKQKTFMVAHCVRFFPEYELLKETINGMSLGKLKLLKLHRISPEPSWGCWKDHEVKATSGGALFDLMIHDIDFLNHALGEPDKIWNPPPLRDAFHASYINSVWEYSTTGTIAIVEGGNCFPSHRPFECGFSGVFENGAIIYNSSEPGKVKIISADDILIKDLSAQKSGYLRELEYFLECVKSGQYPKTCPPEDAATAVRLCRRHLDTHQKQPTAH